MKVKNMLGKSGRAIPNQFIISEEGRGAKGNFIKKETFQSYDSIIAEKITWPDRVDVTLDEKYWNYSRTTAKYRNSFLEKSKPEIDEYIKRGDYKLANLNK